jgi:hypothetical protein
MTSKTLFINRAPVLTLWAAVVAQRLGFAENEALTLGKALAGLNAQTKGRRLGLFKPHEKEPKQAREKGRGEPATPAGPSGRVTGGAPRPGDARPSQITPPAQGTHGPFLTGSRRPREDGLLCPAHRRDGPLCRLHSNNVPRGCPVSRSACQGSGGLLASPMICSGKR